MDTKTLKTLSTTLFSDSPRYVILYVTAVCNARCSFCFYWEPIQNADKLNELSLEELEEISKKFKKVTYLTLTGGEPFLRPDLEKVVKLFVDNCGTEFVNIPTNAGLPTITLKKVEQMLIENPNVNFRIAPSIDAIGEEHNTIRKVKGLFDKILITYAGLCELRKKYKRLNIDVTTTYSSYTENSIQDLLKYIRENLDIDNLGINLARGDVEDEIAKEININRYEHVIRENEELSFKKHVNRKDFRLKLLKAVKNLTRDVILETVREKKMVIPCTAGKKFIVINEVGDVYPCDIFINHEDKLLGKLRENDYDINKLLKAQKAQGVIKWIKDTQCHCTFECGIQNNIVFSPKTYPKVLKKLIQSN